MSIQMKFVEQNTNSSVHTLIPEREQSKSSEAGKQPIENIGMVATDMSTKGRHAQHLGKLVTSVIRTTLLQSVAASSQSGL